MVDLKTLHDYEKYYDEQEKFVSTNESFLVLKKEKKKINNEIEYWITAKGLTTNEIFDVLSTKEAYDSAVINEEFLFEGCIGYDDDIKEEPQKKKKRKINEPCWYNAFQYTTFEIEEIIESSNINDFLYAYFDDNDEFVITNKLNSNDYNFIEKIDQTLDYYDLCKKEYSTFSNQEKEYYNKIQNSIVKISIKELRKYPVQSRQRFCNIVNSIWKIGIWFEPYYEC